MTDRRFGESSAYRVLNGVGFCCLAAGILLHAGPVEKALVLAGAVLVFLALCTEALRWMQERRARHHPERSPRR